ADGRYLRRPVRKGDERLKLKSAPPSTKFRILPERVAAHKRADILAAFETAGILVRFLPRYSPDLSPIEPGWAKLKGILRAKEARTVNALNEELGPALNAITATDAKAWFKLCGYPNLN
ncbi:transposase, partial [Azospirillum soli]|uniref:transposase n=1 Tax=Azospirillum soli TaxID=1304799 RepID=UPI001AEA9141